MRPKVLFCFLFVLIINVSFAQSISYLKPDKNLLKTIRQNMKDGGAQYHFMMQGLPADKFPKTYHPDTDKPEYSNSDWWCSGFYPGTLINLSEETGDQSLADAALEKMKVLAKEQYNKGTHDLGFMMYCSFGTAIKQKPDSAYRDILINSARSLSTRFNPKVGCIKSWDRGPNDFTVIIDNMMNLELLFYATRVTGDSSFYKIAVTHANTTMKNHYRPDHSSYHVLNYDPETGAVKEKKTVQGYANESAWARGQVWGLYGFTVMYRETKDKKYLDQANAIANFVLTNPNLPADKIPYWDFNAPNIPDALRDASAGAIMASALLELCRYADKADAKKYFATAEIILRNLSNDHYKAKFGTNGGFILQHSVGHLPAKSEIDVPLTYADYYFVEAMKRYEGFVDDTK